MLHSIKFIVQIFIIAVRILIQRKRVAKRSKHLLDQIEEKWNGQFDRVTYYKIFNSQAIYIPSVCHAFASLHGGKISLLEEQRFLHYFICSSLFDNFWDRKSLSIEQLTALSFSPTTYPANNFDEKVFQYAHQWLLKQVHDEDSYMEVAQQVFKAQHDSLKQMDGSIHWEELLSITERKGGYSVELCSFYWDEPSSTELRGLWYRLGALIQLTNDLYDVFKDSRDGMFTLPIMMKRIEEVKTLHKKWTDEISMLLNQIPVEKKKKETCRIHLMGIAAFGRIALEQFELLEKRDQNLKNWSTYSRKELIIDMELWKNLWKWLKLTHAMSKIHTHST